MQRMDGGVDNPVFVADANVEPSAAIIVARSLLTETQGRLRDLATRTSGEASHLVSEAAEQVGDTLTNVLVANWPAAV